MKKFKRLLIVTLTFILSLALFSNSPGDVHAATYPTGKNYIDQANVSIFEDNLYTKNEIDVKASTTYTISISTYASDQGGPDVFVTGSEFTGEAEYLMTTMTLSGTTYYATFTTNSNETAISINMTNLFTSEIMNEEGYHAMELQLEEGSSATAYEQYGYAVDETPPLINGATGVRLINVDSPEAVTVLKNSLTATDETDGDVTSSITVSRDLYTGNEGTLGEYEVDFQATDSSGNISTITVTYKVVDVTDPIISLHGASSTVRVEYGTTFVDPGYSVSDNYDSSLTVNVTGTVDNNTLGTYYLYHNATDSSGNTAAQKTRTVIIEDTTAPVQTLTGNSTVYVEFGGNYTEQGAIWTDAYDGSGSSVVSGTVNVGILGTYTVNYNYTDTNGNVAGQISRTVVVRDTTGPSFTGDQSYTFNSGSPGTLESILSGITATDIYDGDLTGSITTITDNYTGNEHTEGTHTVLLRVTDSQGNSTDYTLSITIVDNQSPVFSTTEAIFSHEYVDQMTQQDLKDYFGV